MWWLMVAFNRKGLDLTPKTTRVNLSTAISGASTAIMPSVEISTAAAVDNQGVCVKSHGAFEESSATEAVRGQISM